jgi:hypothetical protein
LWRCVSGRILSPPPSAAELAAVAPGRSSEGPRRWARIARSRVARRAPARRDRRGIIDDQPFLLGPTADKVIGFFAGLIAPVVGLVSTAVTMLVWAGTGGDYEARVRRLHARSVAAWSVLGSLVAIVLVVTFFMALIAAAAHNPLPTSSAPPLP